ncbi:sigma 54-interacting transcriptional regulator [Peptostreptococcus equinus]|uniref:Sigma 54-interacting transcriptional regulator n=1 Tax=Peptostreptococcus equinus TaxID=3003601 RepID=A0ABY7JNI0_9FIRM|nr:sigma 54-interacting transcriptional regulator [Peptostreptococcus sp. CBA3647]WAW14938.1 sigma 54-interacting transcriptional regulator [Peptostreptococcus sp. CBA3647]
MKNDLIKLIKNEDKKNPFTDQQLADILSISRSKLTGMRLELNIASSSDRRKGLLHKEVSKIKKANPELNDRAITEILIKKGYKISRSLVRSILSSIENQTKNVKIESNKIKIEDKNNIISKEIEKNTHNTYIGKNKSKIKRIDNREIEQDAFADLIGFDGSLKEKIAMLKSAMMYPPNGLHTILHGQTGVGKSDMAECMYKFSTYNGFKKKSSPFVIFNCADYAENPNLLIGHLFGVKKGAYTGADVSKEGIVEKADGGILFLDEIHRLPSSGQEILFSLIDRGVYRRLGESNFERRAKVLIICATTGDPNSDLLATFKRRIPVTVEIPKLDDRPKEERFNLILRFFKLESRRVNKNFIITKSAIEKLMDYDCKGNIGQLKSDIQVTCARAFSKLELGEDTVYVDDYSLRRNIREFDNNSGYNWIEDVFIDISDAKNSFGSFYNKSISEIYQYAEKELKILGKGNYSDEELRNIFIRKIDQKFDDIISNRDILGNMNLETYFNGNVPSEVMDIIDKVDDVLKNQYKHINQSLYPALAIHIDHTLRRIREGKKILNPSLAKISKKMPNEFEIARYISGITENISGLTLPDDELGYLAYYVNKFCMVEEKVSGNVKVLIASHGKVGIEMSKVVNFLMGMECTYGVEMPLEYSAKEGLEICLSNIANIEANNGMIILVDMGSLVIIGNEIEKRYGIKTNTVSRADTLLAMEIGKMAAIEQKSFDEIVSYLDSIKDCEVNKTEGQISNEINVSDKSKEKAIISLCLSGHGNAVNIKQILERKIYDKAIDIKVIALGLFDEIDIEKRICKLEEDYQILCIVGTIEAKYNNIPFIKYSSIMKEEGVNEIYSLYRKSIGSIEHEDIKSSGNLSDMIDKDFIFEKFEGISKEYVIDTMVSKLEEAGYVDSKFILSLYKRESMGTLVFNNRIAIPHGLPENVIKPVIAIAKLSKPIFWDNEYMVDLVALIAAKEENQEEMRTLFTILGDEDEINTVLHSDTKDEIYQVFSKTK